MTGLRGLSKIMDDGPGGLSKMMDDGPDGLKQDNK